MPATMFVDQRSLVDQHTYDFFHKERIPLGTALNSVIENFGQVMRAEQPGNELVALLFCKRIQDDGCEITPPTTPIAPAFIEIRASRTKEKHRFVSDAVGQVF